MYYTFIKTLAVVDSCSSLLNNRTCYEFVRKISESCKINARDIDNASSKQNVTRRRGRKTILRACFVQRIGYGSRSNNVYTTTPRDISFTRLDPKYKYNKCTVEVTCMRSHAVRLTELVHTRRYLNTQSWTVIVLISTRVVFYRNSK